MSVVSGCSSGTTGEPTARSKHRTRPDVILISIDTVRADRLHCYGNPRPTSPTIDALAREGLQFRNAFSHAPWTLPSHLALFTSQYPGRYFRGMSEEGDIPRSYYLDDSDPTIATVLKQAGYQTVMVAGGGLVSKEFGFARGFDVDRGAPPDGSFAAAASYVRSARRDQPFFLFVHTYLVHQPYHYEYIFGGDRPPRLQGPWGQDVSPVRLAEKIKATREPATTQEIDYLKAAYDGGIRYADLLLENLLTALKETGRYNNSLIILLSDHGEAFWEHYPRGGHNHSLFDELLRVPLIIRLPHGEHGGQEVWGLARLIDVAPTIFEVAGVRSPGAPLDGETLMPLIRHPREASARVLFAGYTYSGPMRYAVRTARYKYIYAPAADDQFAGGLSIKTPERALYDLSIDPAETTNVVAQHPEVATRLKKLLESYRRADLPRRLILDDSAVGKLTRGRLHALGLDTYMRLLSPSAGEVPAPRLTDELEAQLRALGYVR